MFEIDLKRGSEPEGGASDDASLALTALLPAAGIVASLAIFFFLAGRWMDSEIEQRRTEVAALETQVTQTRQELVELSGKRRTLIGVPVKEVYWSDVMRLLAERLPDKMWVKELRVITPPRPEGTKPDVPVVRTIAMEGGVLSHSSEGNLDVVGKFVEDLQNDPRFKANFASARLETLARGGGTEDQNSLAWKISIELRPS